MISTNHLHIRRSAPLHGLMIAVGVLLLTLSAPSARADVDADELGFTWDRRAVEHVWNRAGFGIRAEEIDHWLEAGPEALIGHLFAQRPLEGGVSPARFEYTHMSPGPVAYESKTDEQKREFRRARNKHYREQFAAFRRDWVEALVRGDDPLRDRMTMFWHGVFTSSIDTVKHPGAMIAQHDRLHDGALGSYEALLRGMLRDPAMLVYLDNDENKKGKPNENLAREVMELFSLGEGNYTEDDVREAARALTGAGVNRRAMGGAYQFQKRRHDDGEKVILGVTGRHGPQDLATILLDQPACATFIARSLIEYLEGVPASDVRVERYAKQLRETGYDVGHTVRSLLLDPAFYRDDVIGARVASPVDYVVGTTRRLGLDLPPEFVIQSCTALGQDLLRPPNVKGWDEGLAWITTASFMMRGNIAGAMLGIVDAEAMRADAVRLVRDMAADGEMEGMSRREMASVGRAQLRRDEVARLAQILKRADYEPDAYLTRTIVRARARDDASVVRVLTDSLLAIEAPPETITMLTLRLRDLRADYGIEESDLAQSRRRSERALRDLAHLILSLPEAQLL